MNIEKIVGGGGRTFSNEYADVNAPSKEVIQGIEEIKGKASSAQRISEFDDTLLRQVVDQIKSNFNMFDTQIHFRVNMQANSVVVEVVDSKTNAVIRQIPSEEMQELKKKIQQMTGSLVDVNA